MEGGRIRGDRAVVVSAHLKADPSRRVTLKFFVAEEDFLHEAQLYEILPAGAAIPGSTYAVQYWTLAGCGYSCLPSCPA